MLANHRSALLRAALAWVVSAPATPLDCDALQGAEERVRDERITGSLAVAEEQARRLLECPELGGRTRRGLQIELARVLDRVGLHQNTRPVAESLEILRGVESTVPAADDAERARIELALAEYFYRAEMAGREFATATDHARRAEALFRGLNDPVGQTDAVHRLGLIALQKRELGEARALFDRSLELSEKGPRRPIFLSDYHRHVGFVDRLESDGPASIGHFERSLAYRKEAGSRDYALFARTTLATALVDGGRAAEAAPHLQEALEIAYDLPSPVGELRALYARGRMLEALGEVEDARQDFQRARDLAAELGVTSIREAASERLQGLVEASVSGREGP